MTLLIVRTDLRVRMPRVVNVSGSAESHAWGRYFKSAGSVWPRCESGVSRINLGMLECDSEEIPQT